MSLTEPAAAPPRLSLPALFLKFLRFGCLAYRHRLDHGTSRLREAAISSVGSSPRL